MAEFIPKELAEYVDGLSEETFTLFPTAAPAKADPFTLTPSMVLHCGALLHHAPGFAQLRYRLCPRVMCDAHFWRVYFTLVTNTAVGANLHLDKYLDQAVLGWSVPSDDARPPLEHLPRCEDVPRACPVVEATSAPTMAPAASLNGCTSTPGESSCIPRSSPVTEVGTSVLALVTDVVPTFLAKVDGYLEDAMHESGQRQKKDSFPEFTLPDLTLCSRSTNS
jgi:hypothetical protein